jgi:transcriptional regulator with XRE-family HTH domain
MSRSAAEIRTRRLLLGMNQQVLADALDITFQQVQKYEHGPVG